MACGCSSGQPCGCRVPFPWHQGPAPAVGQARALPSQVRCPRGSARQTVIRAGAPVSRCIPINQPHFAGSGLSVGGAIVATISPVTTS